MKSGSVARVVLFSVVFVCDFVCLFVCQHDNSWTVRDTITNFLRQHPMVEGADKFEDGYTGVRGWWFIISDALVSLQLSLLLNSCNASQTPTCGPVSGVNASSRLGVRSAEEDEVWGGDIPLQHPLHREKGLGRGQRPLPRIFFCSVISKWHILVNSEVLNLKCNNVAGIFPLMSPQPKYWRGCVPGIPGGVDASGTRVQPARYSREMTTDEKF